MVDLFIYLSTIVGMIGLDHQIPGFERLEVPEGLFVLRIVHSIDQRWM